MSRRRRPAAPRRYSPAVAAARYRCNACGNLTRFDVTVTRRSRAFHHYTLGGELRVDDETVLHEVVEDVACRWCGTAAAVEALPPTGSQGAA